MADVGLPSIVFTMPPERGARSRPSISFTSTVEIILQFVRLSFSISLQANLITVNIVN